MKILLLMSLMFHFCWQIMDLNSKYLLIELAEEQRPSSRTLDCGTFFSCWRDYNCNNPKCPFCVGTWWCGTAGDRPR